MRAILLHAAAVCVAIVAAARIASAGPVDPAPALPPPAGVIVRVSTEVELQRAVAALRSNTAIVLAPGTYTLTSTLWIRGPLSHVEIRGSSGVRDAVVLAGRGMSNRDVGGVPHGIWAGAGVTGLTVANLTIRDVYQHAIILNAGVQGPLIYNVHLIDAGEQFIKSNPDGTGGGVNGGRVEHCVIEYRTTARGDYTNGIDVHTGRGWTIRDNLFRNMRAPATRLAGPAVLMWNGSRDSIVEGNTFINCQREVAFGLIERTPDDHAGGIVRNNFIYRDRNMRGDTAIGVFDSPGTLVLHNSILLSGTYPSPIEYRFADTVGVMIAGNLLDGRILARDGAAGTAAGNDTTATGARFVNAAAGDLHLRDGPSVAAGRVARHAQALADWDGEARPGTLANAGADEITPQRPPVLGRPHPMP